MKHNPTLLTAALLFICSHGFTYGMEKDNKPNIDCEEDVAIVLHFSDKLYNSGSRSDYNHSANNPTHVVYNPVNLDTKKNSISFDDHMEQIEEIFITASQKKIAYNVSAFFFASHCKHVHRFYEDSVALPTLAYLNRAQARIRYYFYKNFKNDNDINTVHFYKDTKKFNLYKIFYKPSDVENKQKEQNDITILTDEYNYSQIKIVDNATINLRLNKLTLKMLNDMTTTIDIDSPSMEIKKGDKSLMSVHGYCDMIFLMDV